MSHRRPHRVVQILSRDVLPGLALWAAASLSQAGDAAFAGHADAWQVQATPPSSGSTRLVELRQGGELSQQAAGMRQGGYETAQGQWVDMARWYRTRWTDTHVGFMTQLDPRWGLLWGFSTGEQGSKYRIAPSLKLGLVHVVQPTRDSELSLRWTTTLGGSLRERACTADYGAIGGVQAVNCRLAASTLAPADTLAYLVRAAPRDRHTLSIEYRIRF